MTAEARGHDDSATIRAWLLGRLSGAEAERLEAAVLESDERFDEVRAVESELFDELASGRMTPADREAFLARHRTADDGKRLAFASALADRAAAGKVVRTSRFGGMAFLAAAAVLTLAVTAILLRAPEAQQPAATDTIAEVAPPKGEPAAQSPPPRVEPLPAPALRSIEVIIVLGTARSDGEIATVRIPSDAGSLALRVELDPADAFATYRLELHAPDGATVFERSDLEASTAEGKRILAAEVPAATLRSGPYEIAVAGIDAGEAEDLGFQTVRIERR